MNSQTLVLFDNRILCCSHSEEEQELKQKDAALWYIAAIVNGNKITISLFCDTHGPAHHVTFIGGLAVL